MCIMCEYMQRPSSLRRMVDSKLDAPLTEWIASVRADGRTVEEAWIELREVTQVPVALRTLYVWLERDQEKKAS